MSTVPYPTADERKRQLEGELPGLVSKLVSDVGASKVVLFGSLAEGRVGPDSDIDLFVIQDTHLDYFARIDQALRRLSPRVALDLVIFTPEEVERALGAPDGSVATILREGRTLYEA